MPYLTTVAALLLVASQPAVPSRVPRRTDLAPSRMASAGHAALPCASLPRPSLGVRLMLMTDRLGDSSAVIHQIVDSTWSPLGITVHWPSLQRGEQSQWTNADVVVVASHAPVTASHPTAIGALSLNRTSQPQLIRIALDAAIEWVRRAEATRFHASNSASFGLTLGDSRLLVQKTIGYAIAHEIGHYLLGSSAHARSGLMQATYRHPRLLDDPAELRLDPQNQARLATRLAQSARCHANAAAADRAERRF